MQCEIHSLINILTKSALESLGAADGTEADTKPLNSEFNPSKSWAEALLGIVDEDDEAADEGEDIERPSKSVSNDELADFTTLLLKAGATDLTNWGWGCWVTGLEGWGWGFDGCEAGTGAFTGSAPAFEAGRFSFLNSGLFFSRLAGVTESQPTGKSGGLLGTHSAAMYFFFSYFCLIKASTAWRKKN